MHYLLQVSLKMMVFISMAIGVEKELHISIEMFFKKMPVLLQKVLTTLNSLLTGVVGGVLLVYGVKLIQFTAKSTLPATQWPACTLYLMIPVAGLFILYFSLLKLFKLERYRHMKIEEGEEADV